MMQAAARAARPLRLGKACRFKVDVRMLATFSPSPHLGKFYIGGRWVDPASTQKMAVMNPATETQVGRWIRI